MAAFIFHKEILCGMQRQSEPPFLLLVSLAECFPSSGRVVLLQKETGSSGKMSVLFFLADTFQTPRTQQLIPLCESGKSSTLFSFYCNPDVLSQGHLFPVMQHTWGCGQHSTSVFSNCQQYKQIHFMAAWEGNFRYVVSVLHKSLLHCITLECQKCIVVFSLS